MKQRKNCRESFGIHSEYKKKHFLSSIAKMITSKYTPHIIIKQAFIMLQRTSHILLPFCNSRCLHAPAYRLSRLLPILLLFLMASPMHAQKFGVKTNLLYDATTTPNIGLEVGLSRKSTAQIYYGLNPWKFGKGSDVKQVRHWVLMPEYRYWFCEKFNGHFVGIHAHGGQYNVGGIDVPNTVFKDLKDNRYEGWFAGGGLSYGYQWMLSKHWNFEASLGVGYTRFHYKQFECRECGVHKATKNKNYFGPTKAVLAIMYTF